MSGFLPKNGGYRRLRVYKTAEVIFDLTNVFVKRFISSSSRTCDQMIQAARSGKQNIAEGSEASVTSRETEIKLTNVAKASLEELLLDYEDYLRINGLSVWSKDNIRVARLREYVRTDRFMSNPLEYALKLNAEEFCNLEITLINQATYMLRKMLETQQAQFVSSGGVREQMYRARVEYRNKMKE